MTAAELITRMDILQMRVSVELPCPYGLRVAQVELESLIDFVLNAEARIASLNNVSVEEYRQWIEDEMNVRCVHVNVFGDRCHHHVAHGHRVTPELWVKMQGLLCPMHS